MRQWFDLIQIETDGIRRDEKPVGYAYRDVNDENGVLRVLDLKRTEVGYLLRDFQAFRFEWQTDVETGKRTLSHREIGSYGREGGVRRILGLSSGTLLEMRRASDVGETASGS